MKLIKDHVIVAYSTDGTLSVIGPFKSEQLRDRAMREMEQNEDWQELQGARLQEPEAQR